MPHTGIWKILAAEAWGTMILVLFGVGAVQAAILTGAQIGLWQIAVVWAIGIALAIYSVGAVSGAHLNPAITIALALFGRHRATRVLPYIAAQLVGAFLGAAVLFLLFANFLSAKEVEKQVVRGEPGSIVTAMCFGEYFPNPGGWASAPGPWDPAQYERERAKVSLLGACLAEFVGTLILAVMVFALTDPANPGRPLANLAPVLIGLTVAGLISVLAPLTQAGLNPARDFGPRLFAWLAGWGQVAWPMASDWSWLTVYILSPIAGGISGGGIYSGILRPGSDPVSTA